MCVEIKFELITRTKGINFLDLFTLDSIQRLKTLTMVESTAEHFTEVKMCEIFKQQKEEVTHLV